MKILLVYPNKVMASRIPMGLAYISSYLKRDGHNVKVFDTTFMKCGDVVSDDELRELSLQIRNPDFKKHGLTEKKIDVFEEFEREIDAFNPDLIAASIVDPNYSLTLELLTRAKAKRNIFTVVGGATPTLAPNEVISENCVDSICVGEGEEAISELCIKLENGSDITDIKNIWAKKDGRVYKNEVRPLLNIDKILLPDWSAFDERHLLRPLGGKMYRMGVFFTSRGCLFPCRYCANLAYSRMYKEKGKVYRIKDPELSVNEISSYSDKYKLNFISIADDIFPLHKPDVLDKFCSFYKEKVGLPFSINLHPKLVEEKAFRKVINAGCSNICVGLESGSVKMRNDVLGRTYDNDLIVRIFEMVRQYKIRSSSFNMIGMPYETRQDIFQTIELNRQAKPTSATLAFFHPYRGTELRQLCIRERLFDPRMEKKYESVTRVQSFLKLPQISSKNLDGLFKTFQLYIKLPMVLYPLIRIAEGRTLIAKFTFRVLKILFYAFTNKEMEWEFTKKGDNI